MNYELIGEQIRFQRKRLKLTQLELAKKVGISWEMISRYERGVSSPMGKLDLLTEALEISSAELLQKSYKSSELHENSVKNNKVPIFITLPENMDFKNNKTHYFYSAPDWIFDKDKDIFMIDEKIVESKTAQVQGDGPIYVSPTLKPSIGDLIVYQEKNNLYVKPYSNDLKGVIGVVIAQEKRFK